jgi:hypothetical protein
MRTLGVIGNISRDLVSYVDGRRYTLLGGAAMHVALAASRAGLSAVPIAVVGGDLASALRDHRLANLDLAYVKVVPEASCTFHLSYGHEGQLTSAECDFGAAARVTNHALSVLGRHDSYHVCCRQPLNVSLILDQLTSGSLKFSADFISPALPPSSLLRPAHCRTHMPCSSMRRSSMSSASPSTRPDCGLSSSPTARGRSPCYVTAMLPPRPGRPVPR